MIDKWGTEIALVIAVVTGTYVMWFGKLEFKKTRLGNIFMFTVGTFILLSLAMYFGLRLQGVNP
jgi:uncharacterized membrane protein